MLSPEFHLFVNFTDAKKHLAFFDGFTSKRAIKGCHNADEFYKAVKQHNLILVNDPPYVNGIKTIEYHVQALDKQLKPTGKPKSSVPEKKTVYDPRIYSDDQITMLAAKAAEKGLAKALQNNVSQFQASANGINFYFYIDKTTDKIKHFHIID